MDIGVATTYRSCRHSTVDVDPSAARHRQQCLFVHLLTKISSIMREYLKDLVGEVTREP